jgi:hypothetical protein
MPFIAGMPSRKSINNGDDASDDATNDDGGDDDGTNDDGGDGDDDDGTVLAGPALHPSPPASDPLR